MKLACGLLAGPYIHAMSSLPSNMSALILSYLHDDSRSYGDEMHDDIGGRYYSRALDSEQLG
jgi:hypothetical protein